MGGGPSGKGPRPHPKASGRKSSPFCFLAGPDLAYPLCNGALSGDGRGALSQGSLGWRWAGLA